MDGASVNFGHKGGNLQRHVNDGSEWLVKMHWANQTVKWAVKISFKDPAFNSVNKQYIWMSAS